MISPVRIALVGEYTSTFLPHAKTDEVIGHFRAVREIDIEADWISAADLSDDVQGKLARYDAIWVAPGSPYKSMQGALNAIRFGRENEVPVLGTCGGCQHIVIEYARNVLGFADAEHAEYDPYASNLFVIPLSCSLAGQAMDVHLDPGSKIAAVYRTASAREEYYCNFGLNPAHQQALDSGGLRIVGRDADGEARVMTIPDHPFFVGTLFVPQLSSTPEQPHPLIAAFIDAAGARAAARAEAPSSIPA